MFHIIVTNFLRVDSQHDDSQHNDTQHYKKCDTPHRYAECHSAACHCTECPSVQLAIGIDAMKKQAAVQLA
jgi:hypothetical protein